jgi:hypothetical protein
VAAAGSVSVEQPQGTQEKDFGLGGADMLGTEVESRVEKVDDTLAEVNRRCSAQDTVRRVARSTPGSGRYTAPAAGMRPDTSTPRSEPEAGTPRRGIAVEEKGNMGRKDSVDEGERCAVEAAGEPGLGNSGVLSGLDSPDRT